MNIATAWKQTQLAQKLTASSESSNAAPVPMSTEHTLLLQSLGQHLRRLDDMPDKAARNNYKREIIPEFTAHIVGLRIGANETGNMPQDEIYAYVMVWLFDIGDYDEALDLARLAITYNLNLPARFKSDVATFITETISMVAEDAFTLSIDFDKDILMRTIEAVAIVPLPGQKRAKLYKALGQLWLRDARAIKAENDGQSNEAEEAFARRAYENFKTAFKLDNQTRIKQELQRLSKRFNPIDAPISEENGVNDPELGAT